MFTAMTPLKLTITYLTVNILYERWMDKQTVVHPTMEYYSVLKRYKLWNHEKTWRNFKCIFQWEKPFWKAYIINESNDMTFWKKQKYGGNKNINGFWGLRRREGWVSRAQRIFSLIKIFCMTIVYTCHDTFVQTQRTHTWVSPNKNYGLWVIMMYQCGFISFHKCTALVEEDNNRETMHVWVWTRNLYTFSSILWWN